MKILSFFAVLIFAAIARVDAQDSFEGASMSMGGSGAFLGGTGGLTVSDVSSGLVTLNRPIYSSGLTLNFNLNQGTSGDDSTTGVLIMNNPGVINPPSQLVIGADNGNPAGGIIQLSQAAFDLWPTTGTLTFTSTAPTDFQFNSVLPSGYSLSPTSNPYQFEVSFVPEPSTWLLMAAGVLALFRMAPQRLARSED